MRVRGALIDRSRTRVEVADGVAPGLDPDRVGVPLVGGAGVAGVAGLLGVAEGVALGVADRVGGGVVEPVLGHAEGKSVAGESSVTTPGGGGAAILTNPTAPAAITTAAATPGTAMRLRSRRYARRRGSSGSGWVTCRRLAERSSAKDAARGSDPWS
ncbi:hypothetical protein EAD89_03170 [Micromonospora sp. BL4]|nr:hypothetical protein EAD89_03170 [Micromonospora sp. BL4]